MGRIIARRPLPSPNDFDLQAAGTRDVNLERNYLGGFYWTHTFSDSVPLRSPLTTTTTTPTM